MENVAYNESESVLGVPYHRPPSDPNSHSFVDLKRELHRLDEIPEVRDEPSLRDLVIKLNDPAGSLRSFGCERWHKAPSGSGEQDQFGSYVGFAIDGWPFEQKQAAEAIVHSFVGRESGSPLPENVKMLFEVRPTVLYDEQVRGWSLDVWVRGFGETRDAAHASWELGVKRFADFIQYEGKRWRGWLVVIPAPTSPATFKIIKQNDPNGCIPACAISVLAYHKKQTPTEADLMRRMWEEQHEGSGFVRLRQTLADVRVDVEEPALLAPRLADLTGVGQLVLVALKGKRAHCLVVERVVDVGSGITIRLMAKRRLYALRSWWRLQRATSRSFVERCEHCIGGRVLPRVALRSPTSGANVSGANVYA